MSADGPSLADAVIVDGLFDVTADVVCVCDRGKIRTINGWGAKRLGGVPADFVGRSLTELLHPDYHWVVDNLDLSEEGQVLIKMIHPTEGPIDVELRASCRGTTAVIAMRDISERSINAQSVIASERRFRRLVDLTNDMICIVTDGVIEFINPTGIRLLGAEGLDQVTGRRLDAFIHEAYADVLELGLPTLSEEKVPLPMKLCATDGRTVDVEATVRRFGDDGGPETFVFGAHDVTAQIRSAEGLREREQRLRSILDTVADGIIIANVRGELVLANPAAAAVFGLDSKSISGTNLATLIPELTKLSVGDSISTLVSRTKSPLLAGNPEMVGRRSDGSSVPIEISMAVFHEAGEKLIVMVVRDITERKQSEERLLYQSTHDTLTNLPNRELLLSRLGMVLEANLRHERHGALLILDVGGLKLVNDSSGFATGDKLLTVIARRLSERLRGDNYLARLGGSEFAIIVPDIAADHEAAILARHLIDGVESPIEIDDIEAAVSANVGIVLIPNEGDDVNDLLRNASAALNRAKEAGRGNLCFFTADINEVVRERMLLRSGLRRAHDQEEFHLLYQPKVDIATGRISGVEALMRWNIPGRGQISPTKFIPILEETTLIGSVGRWVLRTACIQQREWIAAGHTGMRTAVNLSVRQMRGGVVTMVQDVLEETKLQPEHLEIEITELLLLKDTENAITMLNALAELGVMLAIDDFGTGYSSLSYLTRLPLHTIKIDRSFITDMTNHKDAALVVRTIVSMAHSLRRRTVAEGVETPGQLAMLREFGCDEMQGYLFSRPTTSEQVLAMLNAQGKPV